MLTVLEGTRWRALSPDGSTAVATRPEPKGLTLVAWDLPSRRPLRELPLPDGLSIHPPLTISGSTAIVSEGAAPCGEECEGMALQGPPASGSPATGITTGATIRSGPSAQDDEQTPRASPAQPPVGVIGRSNTPLVIS
jgi:hypothetical protein